MNDLAAQAHQLLEDQKRDWEMLRRDYQRLLQSETRTFDFGSFQVHAQFNRARLASVTSKVDEQTIRNRQCFLCDENRPPEQRGLTCADGQYKILCNPFPILPEHFTIVHIEHRPQRILQHLGTMLSLSRDLSARYTVLYNGPQCGASAPDHLHFQAGTSESLPISADYDRIKQRIGQTNGVTKFFAGDYLRPFISFESSSAEKLEAEFAGFHTDYHRLQPGAIEPMMNVVCSYGEGIWRLIVLPRSRHRPSCWFATDDTRMVLSPGVIDMCGLLVMPVERDFRRITQDQIVTMYREVTPESSLFENLVPLRADAYKQ